MHPEPAVWHEAGHAVVARWQGGEVRWVSVESDFDDHEGHTEVAWFGFDAAECSRREVYVAVAGPVAELLEADADPTDLATLSTWASDWEQAQRCLAAVVRDPSRRPAQLAAIVREVAAFLSEPTVRERLARVVDMLDAHRTLDDTLFDDALG